MPSVANIDTNFTELSCKDRMTRLSFHIVGRFVEITNSGNVALFLLAENGSMVVDDNCSVEYGAFVRDSLEDRRYDHHVVFLSQFLQHLRGLSVNGLTKLDPWILFPGAEEERSCP